MSSIIPPPEDQIQVEATASPSGTIIAAWAPSPKLKLWQRLKWIIATVFIATLAAVSVMLWREWQQRFPDIPSGHYIGTISGIGEDGPLNWYLERSPTSSDDVTVVILRPGFEPQRIALVSGAAAGAQALMPLVVGLGDNRLKFTGNAESEQIYRGKVVALSNRERGEWSLELMDYSNTLLPASAKEELKLWILLNNELQTLLKKIEIYEHSVPEQREEIERLTTFVTEGAKLKSKAQEKLREAEQELELQQLELSRKEAQAKEVAQRFDISQRVTAMGKLVSMGRESLEREERWVASMLSTRTNVGERELEEAYRKAQKIVETKRQIEEERLKISRLSEYGNAP